MKEIYNETIHQDKKLANLSAEKFGSDTLNYQDKYSSFNIFLDQNKRKGPPG